MVAAYGNGRDNNRPGNYYRISIACALSGKEALII
jgi:hypothetical protein